ncbi:hypothetical protein BKA70DRAFT_1505872 [Coprinopsis sp. MPI-PUGE-AT-0042]|nr:hypothetical protein BKA70DRAFT_1505872 [Coprinopsis sp. MPI-PUGE-AT-0042]
MSSSEQLNWHLRFVFVNAVVDLNVSAIQVFMWIYMASFLAEATPETRKRRLPYIIASLAILLLTSATSIIEVVYTYALLLGTMPGPEGIVTLERVEIDYTRLLSIGSLLWDISIWISDTILVGNSTSFRPSDAIGDDTSCILRVYRCYIVWYDHPWVTILPACVHLAGTGFGLRTYIPIDFYDGTLDTADISLTVALNVLVTLLISFRLIRAQRELSRTLPDADHKVYLSIVAVLIESAAPLAIFGLGAIILRPLSRSIEMAWRAGTVFEILYNAVSVLAPQLVIFRVASGSSWSDKADTSAVLSHGIAFAAKG